MARDHNFIQASTETLKHHHSPDIEPSMPDLTPSAADLSVAGSPEALSNSTAAGIPKSPLSSASTTHMNIASEFRFPAFAKFAPFYTLQPNLTTRSRQYSLWANLITSYCAFHRIFRLSLSSLPSDLFSEQTINRSLNQNDVRDVLTWMSKPENGGRAEWVHSTECFIYWRTPAEFADLIYAWVEDTGQKGTILTFYEMRQGDAVRSQEWREMDEDLLRKVLNVLVKRGKAQIFGQEETAGVKFF